ncbi:NADH:flavin oxidoreductase [Gordonia phthalatica]|uniref:NADH:flavin oxidoreductase n=1 Tax=Gordonia phthalatica TaxID=1136941 RepID=A0A0N9N2Q4_9ACTN|nr:NADH:flavin oxidoreductase [Gordonia phthalatica]ALG84938.1 NADH:flavin oxidoreductase [Gordonia phthalatica]
MTSPASPLHLTHGPSWPNRMALAPLTNLQSNADGTLSDDEYAWLTRRAQGGFGMVMTCAAWISEEGHTFDGQLGVGSSAHLAGLARLASGLRATGTVSSIQLQHGGRRGDGHFTPRRAAPWTDPSKNAVAMTTAEVESVVADFAAAAVLAESAGFDGAEIHGAHGYLLCQFLDARSNDRTDKYGGSADNRFRIVHEVVDAVRAATGPNFQLGLRLSPERYGIPLSDGRELAAQMLASGRLDYLDMSLWDAFKQPHEPEHHGRRMIDHFVDLPRGETRLGVAGKILSAAQVHECLDSGVDFVLIGTGGILHHDFASRVVADPGFASVPQPVTAAHMRAESIGPAFLEYLSTNWDDFVRG